MYSVLWDQFQLLRTWAKCLWLSLLDHCSSWLAYANGEMTLHARVFPTSLKEKVVVCLPITPYLGKVIERVVMVHLQTLLVGTD